MVVRAQSMKELPVRYLLLIICMSFYSPAVSYADNITKGSQGKGSQAKGAQTIGGEQKNQATRTVRVTTGVEAVQGWETGLVRANPNLARWHWDPIYSYRQGYARLPLQTGKPDTARTIPSKISVQTMPAQPNKPVFNYPTAPRADSRPIHIPFSPQAIEEVNARYKQAEKKQLPEAEPGHEERISGQLSNRKTPAGPPSIATYNQQYTRKESLDTALKYSTQRTSVYGQLLNEKEKSRYNEAKAVKKKKNKAK